MFWPRFVWETLYKHAIMMKVAGYLLAWQDHHRARSQHARPTWTALTPVDDDDDATLDLMTKTTGSREALSHQKKVADLTRTAVHA